MDLLPDNPVTEHADSKQLLPSHRDQILHRIFNQLILYRIAALSWLGKFQ